MPKSEDQPVPGREGESGNIFIIIFVAIVLFAALMYTFSRSSQQGTGNLSERQAELAATDILSYAQQVERAVNRIARRGVSENDISFENDYVAGYANPNCTEDRCKIFKPDGGGASYKAVMEAWLDPDAQGFAEYGNWNFSGRNCFIGFPTTGCQNLDNTDDEIVLFLPWIRKDLCDQINQKVGITGEPVQDTGSFSIEKFTGTFPATTLWAGDAGDPRIVGVPAACIEGDNVSGAGPSVGFYHFYAILKAR